MLQSSNVLALRGFATAMGCAALRRAAERFLQKHFVLVAKTEEFKGLPLPDLLAILHNSELHVQSEEQVAQKAQAQWRCGSERGWCRCSRRR